jgi:hypothetical protein
LAKDPAGSWPGPNVIVRYSQLPDGADSYGARGIDPHGRRADDLHSQRIETLLEDHGNGLFGIAVVDQHMVLADFARPRLLSAGS